MTEEKDTMVKCAECGLPIDYPCLILIDVEHDTGQIAKFFHRSCYDEL